MKKVDILVILLVLSISISFYIIYFSNNIITDDAIVEVTYKNIVIYEVVLEESTNVNVEITSKDKVLTVKTGETSNDFSIESNREILNIVSITYDEIEMTDANCANKYCLHMNLSKTFNSPIVCTNGIMIKLVSDDYDYIIGV